MMLITMTPTTMPRRTPLKAKNQEAVSQQAEKQAVSPNISIPPEALKAHFMPLSKISFQGNASNKAHPADLLTGQIAVTPYSAMAETQTLPALTQKILDINNEELAFNYLSDLDGPARWEQFGQVLAHYKQEEPQYYDKLMEKFDHRGLRELEKAYRLFYDEALQTLTKNGGQQNDFSGFWINNKRVGSGKIADVWLKSIGETPKTMTVAEKTHRINTMTTAEREKAALKSVDTWMKSVMPAELHLDSAATEMGQLKKEYRQAKVASALYAKGSEPLKEKMLQKILAPENKEKLEKAHINNIPVVDFWIDAVDGVGTHQIFSKSQKLERVAEIFDDPDESQIAFDKTMEAALQGNKQLEKVKKAYSAVIERSNLQEETKKLLDDYQDSKLFHDIVLNESINPNSAIHIERSTESLLTRLAGLEADLNRSFEADIKEPLQTVETAAAHEAVDLVFSLLNDRIITGESQKSHETLESLFAFKNSPTQDRWDTLLTQAQQQWQTKERPALVAQTLEDMLLVDQAKADKSLPASFDKVLNDDTLSLTQKVFVASRPDNRDLAELLQETRVTSKLLTLLAGRDATFNEIFDNKLERFAKDPTILDFVAPHSVVDFIGTKISDKPLSKEATLQHFNALMPEEKTLLLAMAQKELKPLYAKDKVNTDIRQLLAQTDIVEQFRTVNDKLDALDTKSSKILDNQDIMMDKLEKIDAQSMETGVKLTTLVTNFDTFAEKASQQLEQCSHELKAVLLGISGKVDLLGLNDKELLENSRILLEATIANTKDKEAAKVLKELKNETITCKTGREFIQKLVNLQTKYENKKADSKKPLNALRAFGGGLLALAAKVGAKEAIKAGIHKAKEFAAPLVQNAWNTAQANATEIWEGLKEGFKNNEKINDFINILFSALGAGG